MNHSLEELLESISINDYHEFDNHHHNNEEEEGHIQKKHGIWCTMLQKIGVKNKRCKEVRLIEPEPFESVLEQNEGDDLKKKKKKKFLKIPKKLKLFKSKKKSKAKEVYETFQNENDLPNNPVDTTPDSPLNYQPDIGFGHGQSSCSRIGDSDEEPEEESYKYIGKKVHIEVLPDSYDLLEESGYETTSNSPVLHGDTEFWSFDDLRDGEEEELTMGERFRRGWRSERAKSMRRSFRKSTRKTWAGLQQSLKYQMTVPTAQTLADAVGATKKRR